MKRRLLCLMFVFALSTHSNQASAYWDTVAIVGGLGLWAAAIIGGAAMIGVSTDPRGDFNYEYSCGAGQPSYCCKPKVDFGKVTGTNCTTESIPNAKCTNPQYLFCVSSGSADLIPAPYVLQKWAKDLQIAGAVIFSVTAAAAIVTPIVLNIPC